jgi:NADPH-dependent glutamate synthase beta subunit-like oxidoreductase
VSFVAETQRIQSILDSELQAAAAQAATDAYSSPMLPPSLGPCTIEEALYPNGRPYRAPSEARALSWWDGFVTFNPIGRFGQGIYESELALMEVRMELARIVINDTSEQQIIVLRERTGARQFPIVIGLTEAYAIDRRVKQMEAEGVTFHCNIHVGSDLPVDKLERDHDAVLLAGGAEHPRDLAVPGRDLDGVHFAMNYLPQQNRRISGEPVGDVEPILATGKNVVVIGGGDTGSDCIGTSFRQGAVSVTQLEILPQPPESENKALTWPDWPLKLRTSSSHEEGALRDFAVMTSKLTGEDGHVKKLHCVRVDSKIKPIPGTEFELDADLVLLAMGFVHPVHEGMIKSLGLELDQRGNVKADTLAYCSSNPKVFAAGDMRRGQSLVVWAIREGRQCAHAVDKFLMGTTTLPR